LYHRPVRRDYYRHRGERRPRVQPGRRRLRNRGANLSYGPKASLRGHRAGRRQWFFGTAGGCFYLSRRRRVLFRYGRRFKRRRERERYVLHFQNRTSLFDHAILTLFWQNSRKFPPARTRARSRCLATTRNATAPSRGARAKVRAAFPKSHHCLLPLFDCTIRTRALIRIQLSDCLLILKTRD
jgi:hypothetical protein